MRSNVYLFATAILAATSAPALSTEMAISDTPVIVYDATPYDAAYAAPSGDGYIPAEGIIYTDDTVPAEMLSTDIIAIEAPPLSWNTSPLRRISRPMPPNRSRRSMPMTTSSTPRFR